MLDFQSEEERNGGEGKGPTEGGGWGGRRMDVEECDGCLHHIVVFTMHVMHGDDAVETFKVCARVHEFSLFGSVFCFAHVPSIHATRDSSNHQILTAHPTIPLAPHSYNSSSSSRGPRQHHHLQLLAVSRVSPAWQCLRGTALTRWQ